MKFLSIGTALPPHLLNQDETAQHALGRTRLDPARHGSLRALYRRSGVRTRHSAVGLPPDELFFPPSSGNGGLGPGTAERMSLYRERAGELAATAAGVALGESGLAAGDITHIVTVSCTGFHAPGVDIELMQRLGLSDCVRRVHVGFMGCHGALNALAVAHAITGGEPEARVLLCSVELCSLHYSYEDDPQRIVANALFSDGAAAAVLSAGTASRERAERHFRLVATGSRVFPDSTSDMSWSIGDHGFEMSLSPRVPELIRRHLRPWLDRWLEANQISIEGVASWVLHPGGPRVLDALQDTLGLGPEQTGESRAVLAECGNMSSATVLFILRRLLEKGRTPPCVMLAFGPGLTAESALLL